MEKYISAIIITFFIYAFAGWIWESFVCPIITGHKIKNSGFLNGPIVPIYGVGAIVVSLLFSPTETILSVFIEGAFVACVIEYLTSWIMEYLYHHRWWDYSDKAFNVNGRVCLEGFLVFGLFSVVCVKYVQPALLKKVMNHELVPLIIVATVLTTLLIIDLVSTVIALTHLEERVDKLSKELEEYAKKALSEFERTKNSYSDIIDIMKSKDQIAYKEMAAKNKFMDKRVIRAFPHLINKRGNK